jgi:cephalosporin hydroxylase
MVAAEMRMEEALDRPLREAVAATQARVKRSTYHGVPTLKSPTDAWSYQEIIWETKPDAIVEVGVFAGGSTLMFAHMLDAVGRGRVVGVDTDLHRVPDRVRAHPRVTLLAGAADAVAVAGRVWDLVGRGRVMVIEDSSHTYANTLKVLDAYAPMVATGCYMVVEDGICHHGLDEGPDPGPYEAVCDWLPRHAEFAVDRSREFPITWNPNGYLKRLR